MTSAAERIHDLLMELVRVVGMHQLDRAVPGHAVSLAQVFALHELDSGTSMSQRDLAERLRLEKSTVSRLVADLERKGLVERERDPENRRLYRLRISSAGRAVHAGMRTSQHPPFARWVGALTPGERDALLTGLTALVRVVRADFET
ncbi:MAG TPA: MarR family transcriptional regulator [Streptosporangiales bacterium]